MRAAATTALDLPTKTLSLLIAGYKYPRWKMLRNCGRGVLKDHGWVATTKCETLLVASVNESIVPEAITGVRSTVEITAQYCTPVPAC